MIRILARLTPDHARPAARRYVGLLAAVVVLRAATCVLLVPVLSRLLGGSPGDAWSWIAVFAAAAIAHAVLQHQLARQGFALGLVVMEAVQHRLADHIAELPLGRLGGRHRLATQRVVGTTGPEIAQTIGNLVTPLALAVAMPLAIAIGLVPIAWPLGLAALAATPLLLGAWWAATRAARRADADFAAAMTDLDDRVLEFSRAQRTLRGARRADPERSTAGRALDAQHVATIGLLRWSLPGQVLFSVASQLALLALAVTALALLQRGELSVTEAVALLVVTVRFLEPFTALGELSPALQSATTTLRGIDEVLAAPALTAVPGHEASSPNVAHGPPEVRLERVTFRHDGAATTTADDVSFVAPAGATTAIVGPSGAGKSTLLQLVARFHDAASGRILIGGRDVRTVAPRDLYDRVSIVFQRVYLFEGSIRDNVLVGDPDAGDEAVHAAAALARVDEIVARLPTGWDTAVGEGGVALSGGERQRVGIARALLKQAPLLLVDEATSSLDPENERAVAAAIAASGRRRTTIVVAHRMQTIERADHIVFVDGGRVIEAGPRAELLAAGGRFAAFHHDHAASLTWTIGRAAHDEAR